MIAPAFTARAETELTGAGISASNTDGFIESDAGGGQAESITGTAVIELGTVGDTTKDAIENTSGQTVTITDNTTGGGAATFSGRVVASGTGSTVAFVLGAGSNATQTFTFSSDIVEASSGVVTIATDGNDGDALTLAFGRSGAAITIDAAITENTGNTDTLTVQTIGDGVTFTDTLANVDVLDLDGDATFSGATTIDTTTDVADGVTAIFEGATTLTGAVTVNGAGNLTLRDQGATHTLTGGLVFNNGTLTVDSDQGTAVTASGAAVTFVDATLILGDGIGNGDTVFDVNTAAGGFVVTTDLDVILPAGLSATDAIILEDDGSAGDDANLTVDTTFYAVTVADAGSATITITSVKTAATIASDQGVSGDDAAALIEAGAAVNAGGTAAEKEAFYAAVGSTTAATKKAAIQSTGVQADSLSGGAEAGSAVGGAVQGVVGQRMADVRSSSSSSYASARSGFSAGDEEAGVEPGSFWIRGFGGTASADGTSSVSGFDSSFGGVVVGYDIELQRDLVLGVYGAYSISDTDGDGAGSSNVEATGFKLGFYASRSTDVYYADFSLDYTYFDTEQSRVITATSATASADYDAHAVSARIEVGKPYEVAESAYVTPKGALAVSYYQADDYTETGGGAFNQTVSADSVVKVIGGLGARFHYIHDAGNVKIIPEVSAMATYDFADEDASASTQFTGGGSSYTVTGTDVDPFGAQVGAGVAFDMDGVVMSANYDGDLRTDYQSHSGRIELRIDF